VSAAFGKPCVALFGPIDSEIRCKYYKETKPIFYKLKCMPCWRNTKIPCKHAEKMTENQSYCMSRITSRRVLRALEEKLL
jgi:ADP-heptose:LPS heptosyltransferase